MAAPTPEGRTYRPQLDGIRAVAVLLVVAFHLGFGVFSGGFTGVDVFFVLSGYLISGLLLTEAAGTGGIRIVRFYARRARRLLPAAVLTLVFCVVMDKYTYSPIDYPHLRRHAVAAALYAANWDVASIDNGYFSTDTATSPLVHFWSLAVEEQFYIVWPWVFVLLATRWHGLRLRAALGIVLAGIFLTSLIWSWVQTDLNGTWAYYSPLTRAWELAAGALLAVCAPALTRLSPRLAALASWVGVAGIAVSALLIDTGTPFPGVAALLPVSSTALVIVGGGVPHRTNARSVLGLRPFQWLGALSFSFYLWHWPLLVIPAQMQGAAMPLPANLLLLAVALVLSVLTYRTVENPVRRSRFLARRPRTSIAIGLTLVAGSILFAASAIVRHRIL